MQYRRLGESGLSVSALSFGNWLTSGSGTDTDTAQACLHAAFDAGITTLDTADAYADTAAETALGSAIAGMRRQSLEVMTKCYYPTGNGPNDSGLGRKHILESIHGSLRRLGTDYVDVYQAHRFDRTTKLEETMVAFADIVRQGKALYIGTSEWTAEQVARAIPLARELRIPLVSNQAQYSMLWRVPEAQVIPECRREGIGIIAWSPLAQGVLTGKYRPGAAPPSGSRATDTRATQGRGAAFFRGFMRDDVLERVRDLDQLATQVGCDMASLALAWVLNNPAVSTAIIGASRPDQVVHNVQALSIELDRDTLDQIDKILDGVIEKVDVHDQTP